MRWQAQEQAAAALTIQAQAMGARPKAASQSAPQPAQEGPKRKPPILSMEQYIKSQGFM